ncbi:MAG: DUF512 domain-containing protein [Firmicutes bacterium]|nr:DUF512 domain-containing protein [Bacillota bacterium]
MAIIRSIQGGSIAQAVGLQVGDQVLSINGYPLTDLLVYRFYEADAKLTLLATKATGEELVIDIEKKLGHTLGMEFDGELFDGIRHCQNHCQFCFVDQMPPNMRSTLYVKDDDYRLSFLYGNYITLTNLSDADWESIRAMNLSPLYISVHATCSQVRKELMVNPRADSILTQLQRLADWGIDFHCQIVLCPGINDGPVLEKTVADLQAMWPAARSVAIVPVGLTRFREGLPRLRPVTAVEARELIYSVADWQVRFLQETGTRFVWLADEFYLLGDMPLPSGESYEDFAQLENGVGLSALFLQDFAKALAEAPEALPGARHVSLATGLLGQKILCQPVQSLQDMGNLEVDLHVIPNSFFGSNISVGGLITGTDLIDALAGTYLGEVLYIPDSSLKDGRQFLDGYVVDEVADELNVPVIPVSGGWELVERVTGPWQNQ